MSEPRHTGEGGPLHAHPGITAGRDAQGPYLDIHGARHRLSAPQAAQIRAALEESAGDPAPPVPPRPAPTPVPAPPTPVPTPAEMPASRPAAPNRARPRPGGPFVPPGGGEEDFDLLPDARRWAEDLGVADDRIRAILEDPAEEWTAFSRTGEASVVTDGEIAVVVSLDGKVVLSVARYERAVSSRPREQAIPRGHGGVGNRYPTTLKDLMSLLAERGCTVDSSGRHTHVELDGRTFTMPKTPSDHRSLLNTIKGIERELGISLER
ncbi:hypothetical protein [Brachybacterium subflavum]|uniref:hypothetical protein n=1 Tax=Brachybacterium subflavum TaxID=2585206 RepID=UPI0012665ECD|nr:hypothetical protein [Brachybacterium subflavum]